MKDQRTIKEEIQAYVDDHKKRLDYYPADIEGDGRVYSFDEYWDILDGISNRLKITWKKAKIIPTREGYKTEEVK